MAGEKESTEQQKTKGPDQGDGAVMSGRRVHVTYDTLAG